MYYNSIEALVSAVMTEMNRVSDSVEQGKIEISSTISYLRNGIKHCVVQAVGETGCAYQVEAFGPEADELYQMAVKLKNLPSTESPQDSLLVH